MSKITQKYKMPLLQSDVAVSNNFHRGVPHFLS